MRLRGGEDAASRAHNHVFDGQVFFPRLGWRSKRHPNLILIIRFNYSLRFRPARSEPYGCPPAGESLAFLLSLR